MKSTRTLLRGVFFALLLAPLLPAPAPAAALLSNKLISCVNSDNDITCQDRLDVSLALSHGLPVTVEAAYLVPPVNNVPQPPEPAIRIRLTKSTPAWHYPLRYLHTVDYAPFEELVKVANLRPGVSACVDGAAAAAPTCGWQLDGAVKIADSQGFCSNRSLLSLRSEADPGQLRRGEELTGRSTLANSFAIAHCLKMSGVTFRGYDIDPPVRDYTVAIVVSQEATVINTFNLTPGKPSYPFISASAWPPPPPHQFKAELLGEKAAPPPELSGYILYIPDAPANDPRVLDRQNNMLLVPRSLVSSDGSECDKIGTSHAAFRSQRSRVDATVAGACLGNQLRQMLENAPTGYLLQHRTFLPGAGLGPEGTALVLPSPATAYSPIGLRIDAAVLSLVPGGGGAVVSDPVVGFDNNGADIMPWSRYLPNGNSRVKGVTP